MLGGRLNPSAIAVLGRAATALPGAASAVPPWASGTLPSAGCGQGCLLAGVGSVRTKKWKPFHHMYRSNYLREMRKAQAEKEARLAAEAAENPESVGVERPDEPPVTTSPFQATRLMRAFDVFPERGAKVNFSTRLNVDLTRESVRGTCNLPHGLQTSVRVLAFCQDDEAEEMLAAGADIAGITEVLRRINTGWLGFDRCLATPSIMPQVLKVSRILGPRKMMPNPKSGTVVQNLKQAIREAKGGTLLEYRAEGSGEVRVDIADATFSDAQVLENLKFVVQTLLRARPRTSGGGGGGGAAGANKAPLPGMAGSGASGAADKDSYFLEACLRLGSSGPPVYVEPDQMMPASVGYFR